MPNQPLNFPDVDSLEKSPALFSEGKLDGNIFFPLYFGGEAVPQNTLYVPPGIADIKRQMDAMIGGMVKEGQITQYVAEPEYKGNSFIPCKINIKAWHPEKQGGLNPSINIW